MRGPVVVCVAALTGILLAPRAHAILSCPDPSSCAQVTVGSLTGGAGATVTVPVSFTQGPSGSGIGQIAAIAFTLQMPSGVTVPLTLADCTPSAADADLPNAVQPDPTNLAGFKLVIENAYCNSRTHCLCPPDSGIPPDSFINVVVYGPNPLPAPGSIVIPPLPSGQLFTIGLNVASTAGGTMPLHVLNQVTDSPATRPPFTALLSVGDKNAVDQTCGSAVPPCNDPNGTSAVAITDGRVLVTGGCLGNCDTSSKVTVDEILTMVNIALGNGGVLSCEAGDANGDGLITIDEILLAVNNALDGCPR